MIFRKPPYADRDPRRIWIEELLGSDLPRGGARREAMIARFLSGGGADLFAALRGDRNHRLRV